MPYLVAIGQTAVGRWRFFNFSKMAAVHLGFVMCMFGPPTTGILVIFITVQNLVPIDAVLSIICTLTFCDCCLKTPIEYDAPKIGVLGTKIGQGMVRC